jgi:hypothetical protein
MHNLFPLYKANKRQPIEDTKTPLSFRQYLIFFSKLAVHNVKSSKDYIVVYRTWVFCLFQFFESAEILGNSYCYCRSEKTRNKYIYIQQENEGMAKVLL